MTTKPLSAQLSELIQLANANGLYDAADWLQARLWSEQAIGLRPESEEHWERPQARLDRTLDASLSEAREVTGSLLKSLLSPTPADKSDPPR